MTRLDSFTAVLDWLKAILLDITEGLRGTWKFWYTDEKPALEELFKD